MVTQKLLAIDLGASSGRVMQGLFDGEKIELSEIHRFTNQPVSVKGSLYWDVLNLFQQVKNGIGKAALDGIPIESLAVDTWGVDYGYLDHQGNLISNPYCHRDTRTKTYEHQFYAQLSKEAQFEKTGVQPSLINTVNQIHADLSSRPYLKEIVKSVLLMPDLVNYLLTDQLASEYTILSTSGLLDAKTGELSSEVLEQAGIPSCWFQEITRKGNVLGTITKEISESLHVNGFKVITGAGHDTASAVLAIPYINVVEETAFISSGTWSLVGMESSEPIVTKEAFHAGLTNEGTFDGNYRILKNTTGLWLYNELLRDWQLKGEEVSHELLFDLSNEVKDNETYINPNADLFSVPGNMEEKIQHYCGETNQQVPTTKGHLVRVVLESLAMSYRNTIEQLEAVSNRQLKHIQMVGGGIQNQLLCQLTADFTKREVIAGPIEASALGNIVSQLMTLKVIQSREEMIGVIRNSAALTTYQVKELVDVEKKYVQFLNVLGKEVG